MSQPGYYGCAARAMTALLVVASTAFGMGAQLGEAAPHTLRTWEVSRRYPEAQVNHEFYPHFFAIFGAQWQDAEAEPTGWLDLSEHSTLVNEEGDCLLLRHAFVCDEPTEVKLRFGYRDAAHVFLNGRKVFDGTGSEPTERESLHLALERGLNELFFEITDLQGDGGLICQTDVPLTPPPTDYARVTKAWETEAVFNIPESVLYDPKREVLYVSSFARVQTRETHQGYLSRLTPEGEVKDHKWIEGLGGPCGMALANDRLYVVECSGHLVEIDPDAGEIVKRHPAAGSTFLNDVAADEAGAVYFSDTSRGNESPDVYRFREGAIEVWKTGTDLVRTNGLFVHQGKLLAGSTGDGFFKEVDLKTGATTPITALAPRIIDGIRVDNTGHYLVSHWEGQLYRITPSGEITEILDLLPEGLNIADFEYIKELSLIVIPTFLGNKIVAYELDEQR